MKEHLLLIPGTLCDERLWSHQLKNLSHVANPSVFIPNQGNSIEHMAQLLLKDAPENFALAGLSLGGIVAMEVARQAPERVTRLAFLNSNPYGPRPDQLAQWDELINMVKKGQFEDIVEHKLLPNLIHPSRQSDYPLTSTIRDMANKIGPTAYIQQLQAVSTRQDARESLKAINVPTLLLVGKEDKVCPPPLHEEMAASIKHSHLIILDNCAHLSSIEQPVATTGALYNWLTL